MINDILLNLSPVEIKRKIECDKKSRDRDTGNEISKRSTLRGEKRVNRICSGRDCEERKRTARETAARRAEFRTATKQLFSRTVNDSACLHAC